MSPPRKRPELLLAATALLAAAALLLVAGAGGALEKPGPPPEDRPSASQNPFEAAQSWVDTPGAAEGGSNGGGYAVGYTGVVVYPADEAPLQPYDDEAAPPRAETPPLQTAPPGQQPSPPAAASYPVNLNTATQAQLETLPGIGPVKAQAILAWRAANGGFANANQLILVKGIGQKTLEGLLPYITW